MSQIRLYLDEDTIDTILDAGNLLTSEPDRPTSQSDRSPFEFKICTEEGRGQEAEGKRLLSGCFSRSIGPNSPGHSDIWECST